MTSNDFVRIDDSSGLLMKRADWTVLLRPIMDIRGRLWAGVGFSGGFSGGAIIKFSPFSGYKRINKKFKIDVNSKSKTSSLLLSRLHYTVLHYFICSIIQLVSIELVIKSKLFHGQWLTLHSQICHQNLLHSDLFRGNHTSHDIKCSFDCNFPQVEGWWTARKTCDGSQLVGRRVCGPSWTTRRSLGQVKGFRVARLPSFHPFRVIRGQMIIFGLFLYT